MGHWKWYKQRPTKKRLRVARQAQAAKARGDTQEYRRIEKENSI